MTIETTLIIMGFCIFACFLVFEWQKAAVPPYQEPLKCLSCGESNSECVCSTFATKINPQATWPFPHGDKP